MSDGLAAIRKLLLAVFRPLKAAGRCFERRLARRLSERYADEITQFDDLARAMRELGEQVHARLDKQEGFQWDQVALARRLARLEDHVEQLLRRQSVPGAVPERPDADANGPAAQVGARKETNPVELIPFRAPMRCAEKQPAPKEAA